MSRPPDCAVLELRPQLGEERLVRVDVLQVLDVDPGLLGELVERRARAVDRALGLVDVERPGRDRQRLALDGAWSRRPGLGAGGVVAAEVRCRTRRARRLARRPAIATSTAPTRLGGRSCGCSRAPIAAILCQKGEPEFHSSLRRREVEGPDALRLDLDPEPGHLLRGRVGVRAPLVDLARARRCARTPSSGAISATRGPGRSRGEGCSRCRRRPARRGDHAAGSAATGRRRR